MFGWCFYIYFLLFVDVNYSWYYALSATIELSIGVILSAKYRLVSYLNYSLIIVNLFGLYLYKNNIPPLSYDIIYAVISIIQVLILIARGAIHGGNRYYHEAALVFIVDFDSRQTRDILHKYQPTKKNYP